MKVIISTPSSVYPWAPRHELLRHHLAGFLARRGVKIREEQIWFVEGGDYQTSLVLESSPDLCRLAVISCLKQWNALLCDDDHDFSEKLREWSERDAKQAPENERAMDAG